MPILYFFLPEEGEEIPDAGVEAPGKVFQGLLENPIIHNASHFRDAQSQGLSHLCILTLFNRADLIAAFRQPFAVFPKGIQHLNLSG